MGLLSSSKASSTTQAASQQSQILSGAQAQSGTLNVGANARYQEAGSIASGGALNIGNTTLGAIGAGATVNLGDPGLGQAFADTVRDISERTTRSLTELFAVQKQNTAPEAKGPSAASPLTSWIGNGWLWLAGLLVVGLGVILIVWRRT